MTTKGLTLTLDNLIKLEYLTENQARFGMAYEEYPVHMLHGVAGSGKSFLAMFHSLRDVLNKETPYKRVMIVRSAVSSRDLGFLPGNIEEKGEWAEAPYEQICKDLFGKHDAYSRLKEQRRLEFRLSSFNRGLTFDNTIVVVDETQNLDYSELYTIMTRIGIESKIIFCGDTRQIDLKSKKDIDKFTKVLDNMDSVHRVEFGIDDIVRSDLVREFIIAEDVLYGK